MFLFAIVLVTLSIQKRQMQAVVRAQVRASLNIDNRLDKTYLIVFSVMARIHSVALEFSWELSFPKHPTLVKLLRHLPHFFEASSNELLGVPGQNPANKIDGLKFAFA